LGTVALFPLSPFPYFKIFVVMVICPFTFNILQLWIIDNILKSNEVPEENNDETPLLEKKNEEY